LIDFRYHLVSIIAVFLALAIGIVVGSQAISPKVESQLHKEVIAAQNDNKKLYQQNGQLSAQLGFENAFAQSASDKLLSNLLTGQSVVLVLAPGYDSATVSGVTSTLKRAGATVTGQVLLTAQFFDTSTSTESALRSTASNAAPAGLKLPSSSADPQISGQQAAAEVIAAAIVDKDGSAGSTMTTQQSRGILDQFGDQNFLQISGVRGPALTGQASMAVVVIPAKVPPSSVSGPFNLALISLTQYLQEASNGAVLAGNLAGSGNNSAIQAVTSGGAGAALMTVDNADTETGQIVVAWALRELLNPHARPANYGAGSGVAPSPAPSPIPTPSSGTTPAKKTRK
jgi:Copper transport outer membrane protein, MctB